MKKILSLLIFCLIGICGWATDVVFDASVTTSDNETASEQTISLDGVTLHLTNGILGTSGQYRIYKGNTLTVSSETTITKIVFTCTANGTTKYGPGCFAAQEGYSYSGKIGTWEGEANSIAFLAEANQVRATSIVVTIDDGETPPEPPTPTIAEIATAAEFIALENNKEFKFTGNLVCVQDYSVSGTNSSGQPYTNRYLYVADETGGIVIYNPDANTPAYETKDVIPGGWTAKKTTYRNLPEATTATDFTEATETLHLDPIEMTINDANASNNYGAYVIIKNVLIRPQSDNMLMEESGPSTHDESVMITDGSNNIILYSTHTAPFNLPTDWESNTRYDVVGILGVYNSTQQIYPMRIKLNDETITTIETVDNGVKKVVYYNMQGIESSKPFDGVNIVTIEYDNGTKKINKVIKR